MSEVETWILKSSLIERTLELFHKIDRGVQPLDEYFAEVVDYTVVFAIDPVKKDRDTLLGDLQKEYLDERPRMRHDLGCFRCELEGEDSARIYATGFRYTFTKDDDGNFVVKAAAADMECVYRLSDHRLTAFLFDMSAVYMDTAG